MLSSDAPPMPTSTRSTRAAVLLVAIALARQGHAAQSQAPSPDALYAERTTLASARRAADLWMAALADNPRDYEAAWKLARADYWLGGHAPAAERRGFYQRGVAAGRDATMLEPLKPEGHFWTAANMGALAESFGIRAGLKYRKPIREELETVLRIDPAFEQGSADRALGRWYQKVPGLFGGDDRQAEAHLRASLRHNPLSTSSNYFLAELLLDHKRRDEAIAALRAVLACPFDPEWEPENQEFKAKARQLLDRLSAPR
jgi:tetratricopeptide (TPR) repeat protein